MLLCSDRERASEGVKQKTVSLWSFINSDLDVYRNPLYWSPAAYQQVLVPIASVRHITLWKGHYCRWNPSMRPQVHKFFTLLLIDFFLKMCPVVIYIIFFLTYCTVCKCMKNAVCQRNVQKYKMTVIIYILSTLIILLNIKHRKTGGNLITKW